ncbi:MAG: DMT family transporter [Actinomycetota bacterium]
MKRTGYFLVLAAIVLFSTIEVVSKYLQSGQGSAGEVGATQVAALRFFLGTLFLVFPLFRPRNFRKAVRAAEEDGLSIVVLGAVGVFLTFLLFHLGVEKTNASTAAVIFSMNPVFTVLVAYLALKERLGLPGWMGVVVGFVGAFAAITGFRLSGIIGRGDFLGGLLMLLSALCWSFYTVYGKKYSGRYGGLVVSFLSMVVGSLFFALLLTVQGGWGEMGGYSGTAWLWLAYLGAITVGIGYILYFEGIQPCAFRPATWSYLHQPCLKPRDRALLVVLSSFCLSPLRAYLLPSGFPCPGGILQLFLFRATSSWTAFLQVYFYHSLLLWHLFFYISSILL